MVGKFIGEPVRALLVLCAGIWGEEVERVEFEVSDSAWRGDADSERELTPDVVDAESTVLGATLMRPCASRFWTVTDLSNSAPPTTPVGDPRVAVVVMTEVCLAG
jgi:hypothetical protein